MNWGSFTQQIEHFRPQSWSGTRATSCELDRYQKQVAHMLYDHKFTAFYRVDDHTVSLLPLNINYTDTFYYHFDSPIASLLFWIAFDVMLTMFCEIIKCSQNIRHLWIISCRYHSCRLMANDWLLAGRPLRWLASQWLIVFLTQSSRPKITVDNYGLKTWWSHARCRIRIRARYLRAVIASSYDSCMVFYDATHNKDDERRQARLLGRQKNLT